MRLIIILFLTLAFFSCKSEMKSPEYSNDNIELLSTEKEVIEMDDVKMLDKTNQSYEELIIPQLRDYFELTKLLNEHPEFKEDIKAQLKNHSTDSLINFDYEEGFKIENIRADKFVPKGDSQYNVTLVYDVVMRSNQISDTIIATVKQKEVMVDGRKTISSKVIFSKY